MNSADAQRGSGSNGHDVAGAAARLFNQLREEPVLLAALFFFSITALMLLRPAGAAPGMQRGIEAIRWLVHGQRRDDPGQALVP
jgi:hypothetical protein